MRKTRAKEVIRTVINMKQAILLFLAILAVGSAATFKPGLRVKFDVGLGIGKDFFYDMPRTVDDALARKWPQMERPPSPMPSLVMYCLPDEVPYFCCLYEPETKYIAAVQVAIPLDEFTGSVFDWVVQGFITWKPTNMNYTEPVTYMTKQLYFISEATLLKSKTERLKAISDGRVLQEDAIWPVGFNQKLMEVPTNVTGIENSGFVKQSCIPWMGQHYFYKMTRDTKCLANTILNYFLLVDSGKLIGVGFFAVGFLPKKDGHKYYFERPSTGQTKTIIKYSPDCLLKLAEKPSATTMHIYFIDKPWLVGCLP